MKKWISVNEGMPKKMQTVYVSVLTPKGKQGQSIATYIPPKSVLFEDYMDSNYTDDYGEYDDEIDNYWTPSGFYENQMATEVNFMITESDGTVTHWMPLFNNPKI